MSVFPDPALPHIVVMPIVLPLATAAVLLLISESNRRIKATISVFATGAGLLVAVALMRWIDQHQAPAAVGVYLPSNWSVPFGIVLVADRLSALMLVLTATIGFAAALYGVARWDRAGVHYHTLFQIQLMGVNGAFLTGDLFNLFVFFEVMLVASYGLLLHGSGAARVATGLRYVAINLLASTLFLVGVAVLYGITGTLNFADMAQRVPQIPASDRGLLHAGAAILAVAFLAKAALWPLNAWLVPAYAAAAAPVAALFAILTKVGVYAVLRLWTLLLAAETDIPILFGGDALVLGGFATLAFGAIGMLASQQPRRLAGYALIISSGTLVAAIGFGHAGLLGGALYYVMGSTLATSALYLLAELIERGREVEPAPPIGTDEADHLPFYLERDDHIHAASDDDDTLIGRPIPAATAFLGLGFVACALMIAGLPPLAGFLGKFAMLTAAFEPGSPGASVSGDRWTLLALLLGSGMVSMIALSRAGVRNFWAPQGRPAPRLRVIECAPIAALLAGCAALTIAAEPAVRYARAAADGVVQPARYIEAVLSATPRPSPAGSGSPRRPAQ
jgi:multicomponent K+:H+ antiporter subunit D